MSNPVPRLALDMLGPSDENLEPPQPARVSPPPASSRWVESKKEFFEQNRPAGRDEFARYLADVQKQTQGAAMLLPEKVRKNVYVPVQSSAKDDYKGLPALDGTNDTFLERYERMMAPEFYAALCEVVRKLPKEWRIQKAIVRSEARADLAEAVAATMNMNYINCARGTWPRKEVMEMNASKFRRAFDRLATGSI
jgi:hypothetical protein